MDERPALSVVILTLSPWPAARVALESVYAQAVAAGAEIVLLDGRGDALPDGAYPAVRRVVRPGATMHQLMACTLTEARGEVLAMTEDHCAVSPGWCEAVLRAHAEFPEADAIGGRVENGATGGLLDWANFLSVLAWYLPPVAAGRTDAVCGRANLSLKRRALPAELPAEGIADYTLKARLIAAGRVLWNDPRLVVAHVQSHPGLSAFAHQMRAGRSSTALIHADTPPGQRRREGMRRLVTLPWVALRDTWRLLAFIFREKRDYRRIALASAPAMAALRATHIVGEALALLYGPGGGGWSLA